MPFPDDEPLLFCKRMHSMIEQIKPERTDLDVVCELMLKMGIPLNYSVTKLDMGGKSVWSVGDYLLLICLDKGLTPEDIEEMADHAPGQIVLADHSLEDDTAMSNAYYILQNRGIALKLL